MIFNYKTPIEKRINTDTMMTGFVVMNDEENKHVGVVIPRIMPHIPTYEKSSYYSEDTIWSLDSKNNTFANSNVDIDFEYEIIEQNYAWVNPMEWIRDFVHLHDQSDSFGMFGHKHPDTKEQNDIMTHIHNKNNREIANHFGNKQPSVGEEVICTALDGDPQKIYWLPYAPALKGS